jgi:6-phosphogluconolactonase
MQRNVRWRTFSTADQVAEAASEQILATANEAIAERGCFKLVLAGGTTPEKAYRLLVGGETDWSKWRIYYGDERCLPNDHPDRNSRMATNALLAQEPIPDEQIFTIPAELGPEVGARQYRQAVGEALPFDLVLLGMGEDGHTASLFPGHVHDRDELTHAVYNSPKPPPERVSISAKALSDTRRLIFLVTGKSKQEPVRQWQSGADLPVAAIEPHCPVEIYIDSDALPA